MRLFHKLILLAAVGTGLGACYTRTYYYPSSPRCAYNYYWDGVVCRHY